MPQSGTSFQRLRRGLNILDRYSGVIEVKIDTVSRDITIPMPPNLTVNQSDMAKLHTMGWKPMSDNREWVFTS